MENRNLIKFVIAAFKNLSQKYTNLFALVLFIIFFKIGDAFAGSLLNVFLLKGLNLSLVEIGSLNKIISIISTIIGAFVGGIILSKDKYLQIAFNFWGFASSFKPAFYTAKYI